MLVEDVSVPIPDSLVKFQQLIRAGLDMGIYDGALFAELEKLNQHRNTVHLGKHWMRIKQIRIMDAEERQSACETVEKLRCALLAFVPPPPEPEMDIPF